MLEVDGKSVDTMSFHRVLQVISLTFTYVPLWCTRFFSSGACYAFMPFDELQQFFCVDFSRTCNELI